VSQRHRKWSYPLSVTPPLFACASPACGDIAPYPRAVDTSACPSCGFDGSPESWAEAIKDMWEYKDQQHPGLWP